MFFRRGRRRKILIDRRLQLTDALAGVSYVFVIAVCLSLPFTPLVDTMRALSNGLPAYLIDLIDLQERFAILTFVLCSVWLACAWVLFAVGRTQRIAGPAHRLAGFMNGITENDLSGRIKLRSGDELQTVAVALNNMLDRIEKRGGRMPEPARQPASREEDAGRKPPVPEDVAPR